jgi:hypothetical protein
MHCVRESKPDFKVMAWNVIIDRHTKMSARVSSALMYLAIRIGEIIDWWFPVKATAPVKT